ncbi:MAG: hypothetical protein Q4F57_09200 [Weeksellaceae bacterium]|nr:hypothetical protein [Weeksellaceae bacterium]
MNLNTPHQTSGNSLNTIEQLEFQNGSLAQQHFVCVKNRLLDINNWFTICDNTHSKFCLCGIDGLEKSSALQAGDFIRIEVKGPQNTSGDGDDWVMVENIIDKPNEFSFRVRPCSAPTNNSDKIAHFFDERSTNTFGVRCTDRYVIVEINGRNEHINSEGLDMANSLRNTAMALGGFLFGSKSQWEKLAQGLLAQQS